MNIKKCFLKIGELEDFIVPLKSIKIKEMVVFLLKDQSSVVITLSLKILDFCGSPYKRLSNKS